MGVLHNVIGTRDTSSDTQAIIKDMLKLLLQYRADPASLDRTIHQYRPLHRAAHTKNCAAAKVLLDAQKSIINLPDGSNNTALWLAYKQPGQDLNLVKMLAAKGGTFGEHKTPEIQGTQRKLLEQAVNDGRRKYRESQRR